MSPRNFAAPNRVAILVQMPRWNYLKLGWVATWPDPAASVPSGPQIRQFVLAKQGAGGERVQIVRALDDATAVTEIALDGMVASIQMLGDFPARHALETGLDCPTPNLVCRTFAFHPALENACPRPQRHFCASCRRCQINTE